MRGDRVYRRRKAASTRTTWRRDMADKPLMMGPRAWARHEEEVAKKQVELRAQGLDSCDVGFGPGLLAYGVEALREAFMPVVADMSEGMFIVNFDGRRVYVYR